MTNPTFTVSHAFLPVDDPDKAIEFYCGVLGFTLVNDVKTPDFRWVTVTPPGQAGMEIVLEPAGMGRSPGDGELREQLLSRGSLGGMIFRTDDLDAAFEHIRASGAEVLQEPMQQPYGVRDCAFRDPAGNHLRFNQAG
jgi:catechol 2,3-dioxygenase-like lactoylglutathione lyase family enzyme